MALETAVYLELRRRSPFVRKNQVMFYDVREGIASLEVDFAQGTFYLHYRDVYDLHEQLVSWAFEDTFVDVERVPTIFHDARRFVDDYQDAVDHIGPEVALVIRTVHRQQYQRQLTDMLVERVYVEGEVERCLENDVRLFALFSAFLSLMACIRLARVTPCRGRSGTWRRRSFRMLT